MALLRCAQRSLFTLLCVRVIYRKAEVFWIIPSVPFSGRVDFTIYKNICQEVFFQALDKLSRDDIISWTNLYLVARNLRDSISGKGRRIWLRNLRYQVFILLWLLLISMRCQPRALIQSALKASTKRAAQLLSRKAVLLSLRFMLILPRVLQPHREQRYH